MNDKFYVYMSGGLRIVLQSVLALVLPALTLVVTFVGDVENSFAGIIISFAVAACTIGGMIFSALTTRAADYILLGEEGISYRHLGSEKLFIGYGQAAAVKTKIAGMRGKRCDDALVIGVRGSLPDDPASGLRGFKSLDEGWFVCVYDEKLAAALTERLGKVEGLFAEESGPTGVIDGEGAPVSGSVKMEVRPRRRKKDDTHDDGDGDAGGWRCD